MKYKKTLEKIVYFCLVYTAVLFVSLFLFFFMKNAQQTKTLLEKTSTSIANRVSVMDIQFDAIHNEVVNSEYYKNYVNSDSKFDKSKLQNLLYSYANSAAPSIYSVAVIRGNDFIQSTSVISSRSTMTYDYYASSLSLDFFSLTKKIKNIGEKSGKNDFNFFISGDYITIIECDMSISDTPTYFLVSFYFDDIIKNDNLNGMHIAFFVEDNLFYTYDGDDVEISAKLYKKQSSNLYYVASKTATSHNLAPNVTIMCFKGKFTNINDFLTPMIFATLISLLMLLIGIYVANKFTKRLYAPINNLLQKLEGGNDEIDDEFEVIGKFVDEISSKNSLMKDYIEESEKVLENQLLITVLLGSTNQPELKNILNNRGITHDVHDFSAVILSYVDYEELYASLSELQFSSMKSAITNLLYESFSDYEYFKVVNVTPETHIIVHAREKNNDFGERLENCLKMIKTKLSINLLACMGRYVNDFHTLHESYSEALFISRCNLPLVQNGIVYTIDDIKNTQSDRFFYPIDVESELITAVHSLNADSVNKAVDMLIKMNSAFAPTDEQFILLTTMFYSTISRILSEINAVPRQVFGDDVIIYLELRKCGSLESLKEKIIELLGVIMQYIHDANESDYNKIKANIEKFVAENYQHDISLSDLAGHLNLSETYVSKLFKTIMNKNFKEYVMYYKYKKAKQIMAENPTYRLKDVASMVGCNTVLTFSRLLKKFDK